jgi:hypothetical protein
MTDKLVKYWFEHFAKEKKELQQTVCVSQERIKQIDTLGSHLISLLEREQFTFCRKCMMNGIINFSDSSWYGYRDYACPDHNKQPDL